MLKKKGFFCSKQKIFCQVLLCISFIIALIAHFALSFNEAEKVCFVGWFLK